MNINLLMNRNGFFKEDDGFSFLDSSISKINEENEEKEKKKNPFESKEKKEEGEKKVEKKEEKEKKEEEQNEDPYSFLTPYIDNFEGNDVKEKFNAFLNKYKEDEEKVKRIEELEKADKEKENRLRAIDITQTREWNERFEKPFDQAKKSFVASLAEVDEEGKIKYEKGIAQLANALWNKGEEIDAIGMKAILKKFASEYEKQTGEVYEIPPINEIVKARNELYSIANRRDDAFKNWEKEREEEEKRRTINEEEENKKLVDIEKKKMDDRFSSVLSSFDYATISPFLNEDKVKEEIKKVHSSFQSALEGKGEEYSYSQMLSDRTKAALYDLIIKDALSDREFVVKHKGLNDNREGKGGVKVNAHAKDEKGRVKLFDF